MTTERCFSLLLAGAVLSLLFASTGTARAASTSQSHVNGPSANASFCTPDGMFCGDLFVFTNSVTNGSPTLTVGYGLDDFADGIAYFGSGLQVPNAVFSATAQSATLSLNIDSLINSCINFDPTSTCTALTSGSITVTWTVNGVFAHTIDGTTTTSGQGISFTIAGHLIDQSATAQGTMLGFNFDNPFGGLGRTDMVTLTITTQ